MSVKEENMILPRLAELSKKEAILFELMIKNRDKYNVVKVPPSKLLKGTSIENWNRSYLSQRLKKMRMLDLIEKIGSKWIINPFVIAPKYDEDDPESQWRVQQIWKRLFIDKDAYYDGIDDDIELLKKGKLQ